ncbi:MAG: hypothetical protein C0597_01640 [Marinilabiliales bacterium]|mgnify:CR=1 FL=1|nr:MAG: hypothetical protein C0597_01640 [Marinilabiliales bacterium]
MNRKSIRILYHILFWIVFALLLPIWYNDFYSLRDLKNLITGLTGLPGFILGLYFIVYYLIPNLLIKKQKYFLFALIYVFVVIGLTFHDILAYRYFLLPNWDPQLISKYETYIFNKDHILRVFIMMQTQIFIFISLKYLKNYIESYFEKEKLKAKMTETELNMLKGQIHPHFLFNTLNNIYTLSIDADNNEISKSIEKLSEFLRYTIYECKNKVIALEKEISIIKNYIELEKLRYSKLNLSISFPKTSNYIYVIPMMYFTFVENAFKHGTSKSIKDKWLDIKLEILDDEMLFVVKNSKSENLQSDPLNYSNGIGLENAKKRLDLYFGQGNYNLDIKNRDNSFEINLCHKILDNNGKVLNYR